jgi:hypothetical protein
VIFRSPKIHAEETEAIEKIEDLWRQLRRRVSEPRQWLGGLRRLVFTRSVAGSNSIEGYHASLEDVMAAVEDEPTVEASDETQIVLRGYRDAMTYVLQLADDNDVEIDESLIKSLHFMMMKHDLTKRPGRWRTGDGYVRREPRGEIVYEGPDSDLIPGLVSELVACVNELDGPSTRTCSDGPPESRDDSPVQRRATVAWPGLFRRWSWRGRRSSRPCSLPSKSNSVDRRSSTTPCWEQLEKVRGVPKTTPRLWVRFCLDAHFKQAERTQRRVHEIEDLWGRVETLVAQLDLPAPIGWPPLRCFARVPNLQLALSNRRGRIGR